MQAVYDGSMSTRRIHTAGNIHTQLKQRME
jgi:hypothetical protein